MGKNERDDKDNNNNYYYYNRTFKTMNDNKKYGEVNDHIESTVDEEE